MQTLIDNAMIFVLISYIVACLYLLLLKTCLIIKHILKNSQQAEALKFFDICENELNRCKTEEEVESLVGKKVFAVSLQLNNRNKKLVLALIAEDKIHPREGQAEIEEIDKTIICNTLRHVAIRCSLFESLQDPRYTSLLRDFRLFIKYYKGLKN